MIGGYNFTERVRRVLANAREEAALLHHEYVGTEHILLALLGDDVGVATTVFEELGIDRSAIRRKIEETVKRGKAELSDPDRSIPYTSRGKKVLELAMREARELGHSYVGTEHLLLGLLREEKGIAAQVLTNLAVTYDGVRAEVMSVLGEPIKMNALLAKPTKASQSAPQILSERERMIACLRTADAVSPAAARSLSDLRCKPDAIWQSLVDEGTVREGPPGTFYLYERSASAYVFVGSSWKRFAKVFVFWLLILLIPIFLIQFTGE